MHLSKKMLNETDILKVMKHEDVLLASRTRNNVKNMDSHSCFYKPW